MNTWKRLSRRTRTLIVATVAIPLVYLLPANVVLNSGLVPALINRQPANLFIGWSSAWSLWPGRVQVHDFHMRVQDPGAQWELTIDKATTQVVLSALLRQTFQTAWVQARGVQFRFRPRVAQDTPAALLEPYPPIAGFPTNFLPEHPEPEPVNPWTVRLEQISVKEAREVWIAAYHGRIEAEVTQGRVELRPDRSIRVGPAHLQLAKGTVTLGKIPVLDSLNGSVDCSLDVKDIKESIGAKVLKSVNATVKVAGALHSAAFVNYHFPIELAGGDGWLEVAASIDHGVLIPGSRALLTSDALVIPVSTYQLSGPLRIEGRVDAGDDGKARSTLDLSIAPFHLRDEEGSKRFESPGLRLSLTATDLLLGEAPIDGALKLDLNPTAPFPLRRANTYIGGASFKVDSGTAVLDAVTRAGGISPTPDGSINLQARQVAATFEHIPIKGDVVAHLLFSDPRLETMRTDFSGSTVEVSRILIGTKGKSRSWHGVVNLQTATVALSPQVEAHAHITGTFSNAFPFLMLFGEKAGFPGWAIPLFEAKGLKVSGTLAFVGTRLVLKNLRADGVDLKIQGQLDITQKELSCIFLVKVHGFEMGLKRSDGKVEAEIFNAAPWFAKQVLASRAAQ